MASSTELWTAWVLGNVSAAQCPGEINPTWYSAQVKSGIDQTTIQLGFRTAPGVNWKTLIKYERLYDLPLFNQNLAAKQLPGDLIYPNATKNPNATQPPGAVWVTTTLPGNGAGGSGGQTYGYWTEDHDAYDAYVGQES